MVVTPCISQFKKSEVQKKMLEARNEGLNYVVLASGEKKEIKSAKLPNQYGKAGKIEFADGTSMKLEESDIVVIQTGEGFYKRITYHHPTFGRTTDFAVRQAKGVYDVYRLQIHYNRGLNDWVSNVLFFMEKADGTGFVQFNSDYKHIDYVDSLTSKSKAARESIAELRKAYRKSFQVKWSMESKLAETVELYNKDAAAGKLEN